MIDRELGLHFVTLSSPWQLQLPTSWGDVVSRGKELYKAVLGSLFLVAPISISDGAKKIYYEGPLSIPPLIQFSLHMIREFEIIRDHGPRISYCWSLEKGSQSRGLLAPPQEIWCGCPSAYKLCWDLIAAFSRL